MGGMEHRVVVFPGDGEACRESADWQPAGTTVLRLHLAVAGVAMATVWALAGSISALLHEPALAGSLRLFAIEIPIFGIAYAHRSSS